MSATLDAELAADPTRCPHGYHPAQTFHSCAAAEKRIGQQRVDDATDDDVKAAIDASIRRWAKRGVEFSANDLRAEYGDLGNVVGSRFSVAAKRGLIRDTKKRIPSTLASTHQAEVRVWIGAG